MTRVAQCCCGACSIEAEGDPVIDGICHCANCNRCTGSAFGWSACFGEASAFRAGIAGGCFTETPLPEPTATVANNGRCAWLGLSADWRTSI